MDKINEIIKKRRSIRKYKRKTVSEEMVREIIEAGMLAPSSKNRQPWRFYVITGESKRDMISVMKQGIEREKISPALPESRKFIRGAEYTLEIMKQAPVIIFISNPFGKDLYQSLTPEERVYEICNAQSVGAAMENMILTAVQLGLGSLWICDIYFAYEELKKWLEAKGELIAALAVGYADEVPSARPRKSYHEVVKWRT
ncbi:MAG: nitroreductase family protein [Ruminococcus sp.]|jgi:nitroreductase